MSTINDLYRRRQGLSPTACPPEPPRCSTCGMLECLCRPRFFPGQILTADDLNRLDAYVRGKHRLHNRQLHGWGVVNGLEVTCNPCGDGVAVGCGYALSPCGDDIVVCEPVTVDVCALIRRCTDAERAWQPCTPPSQPGIGDCPAAEEEWVLAIRYAESPARGVKPLRPGEDCGCNGASAVKPRGAPVQCEATVVCEGFAFEVYRKPPDPSTDPVSNERLRDVFNPESELYERFRCCLSLLWDEMPRLPGPLDFTQIQANSQAWYQWTNQARAQLARYLATHGSTHCELLARFNAIVYPPAGTAENTGALVLAVVLLLIVWMDALLACFCSALLPPCPAPADEARVPIASLHVGGRPCRVLRVCNWSVHRKVATTFPALQYWLSLLPIGTSLRRILEAVCCLDLSALLRPQDPIGSASAGFAPVSDANQDPNLQRAAAAYQQATARLNPVASEPQRLQGGVELIARALGRAGGTLELATLAGGLLLPADRKGDATRPSLSPAEAANLPQLIVANQLLRPLAAGAMAPMAGLITPERLVRGLAGAAAQGATAASVPADEAAALRAEIAELRAGLKAQAEEIEHLKSAAGTAPRGRGPKRPQPDT